jgi:hypothetical protein
VRGTVYIAPDGPLERPASQTADEPRLEALREAFNRRLERPASQTADEPRLEALREAFNRRLER